MQRSGCISQRIGCKRTAAVKAIQAGFLMEAVVPTLPLPTDVHVARTSINVPNGSQNQEYRDQSHPEIVSNGKINGIVRSYNCNRYFQCLVKDFQWEEF